MERGRRLYILQQERQKRSMLAKQDWAQFNQSFKDEKAGSAVKPKFSESGFGSMVKPFMADEDRDSD
jgi:hypothetical protein